MVRTLHFLPDIVYLSFRALCTLFNGVLALAPINHFAKPQLILERMCYSTVVPPARLAFTA